MEAFCVNHPAIMATYSCSIENKYYCVDCIVEHSGHTFITIKKLTAATKANYHKISKLLKANIKEIKKTKYWINHEFDFLMNIMIANLKHWKAHKTDMISDIRKDVKINQEIKHSTELMVAIKENTSKLALLFEHFGTTTRNENKLVELKNDNAVMLSNCTNADKTSNDKQTVKRQYHKSRIQQKMKILRKKVNYYEYVAKYPARKS